MYFVTTETLSAKVALILYEKSLPILSFQIKTNSNPRVCKDALFLLGALVPKVLGSASAGPNMLVVVLLYTSKDVLKRSFKKDASNPKLTVVAVSHVKSALTSPGAKV